MNPDYDSTPSHTQSPAALAGLEVMDVTGAREHKLGDSISHHVEVQSNFFKESMVAPVAVTQVGDIYIPQEGDRVLVGYRSSGQPIVLGTHYNGGYTLPEYKPGERRIGHPASNAFIRLKQNGEVRIESHEEAVILFRDNGSVAMTDKEGYGIEAQNNGEVHIYGKVKQHTSSTLDL